MDGEGKREKGEEWMVERFEELIVGWAGASGRPGSARHRAAARAAPRPYHSVAG